MSSQNLKYQQLKNNLSQVQIEIVSKTPEFQALHWEALPDPDFPRPLAVDCVMLRKIEYKNEYCERDYQSDKINTVVLFAFTTPLK